MDWKKSLTMLLGAVIIALGLIIAANLIASRPMQGSLSGSITSGESYTYSELLDTRSLLDYIGIYPETKADYSDYYEQYKQEVEAAQQAGQPQPALIDPYEQQINDLHKSFESAVIRGEWPDFPFVQANGKMLYSKSAVNEWFAEKGKQRLIIK